MLYYDSHPIKGPPPPAATAPYSTTEKQKIYEYSLVNYLHHHLQCFLPLGINIRPSVAGVILQT